MHKLAKMKKTTGEILAVHEITEKNNRTVKNFGIWLRCAVVSAEDCRRTHIKQFHNAKLKFPLSHRIPRPSSKRFKSTFKANRPNTFLK